jgi:imidazolonepropionase
LQIDAAGKVVMPGLVDPHTHPIFAGSRAHEVEWKSQGLSYSEIAARGGGILHTVLETRKASEEDLARDGAKRLRAMASFGTTTIEAKSGYGLRTEDELKLLRAIGQAGQIAGLDVVPTFLGAHAVPPEFQSRREDYVALVEGTMLEAVASHHLAAFCDVFVDEGYFSADDALRILTKARQAGLRPRVHADELSDAGGAVVAAKIKATSADHLNHVSPEGVDALAGSDVVAVLLPASSLSSHLPFADGRRLVAAGVPVAVGTDFNANNWFESMALAVALACHHNGLTPAEAVVAATINAAHALGREGDVGSLEPGKQADVLILDLPSWRHLGYRLGGNAVEVVVKKGRIIVDHRPAP